MRTLRFNFQEGSNCSCENGLWIAKVYRNSLPQKAKRRIICHGEIKALGFYALLDRRDKGLKIYNADYASVDAFYCDGRTFGGGFCCAFCA